MDNNESKQLAHNVGDATNRLVNTGNRLIGVIEKSNEIQQKHNSAIVWLTGVIAVATVIYAFVTVWSIIVN